MLLVLPLAVLLVACSPALNWRDVRVEGSALTLQMPCRPNLQSRTVSLGGQPVQLQLLACDAAGLTWAVAHGGVAEADGVDPALRALQAAALANIGATPTATQPWAPAGATPQASAARLSVHGTLPDGQPVQMQLAVFADGLQVHQVTLLGPHLAPDAAQSFFDSLRIVR